MHLLVDSLNKVLSLLCACVGGKLHAGVALCEEKLTQQAQLHDAISTGCYANFKQCLQKVKCTSVKS